MANRIVRISTALVFGITAPALAQTTWKVDPAPILDVSGNSATGMDLFSRVSGATRLPNGTIIIADADEFTLHFFDATGKPTHAAGRQGSGPGEFQHVSWMGRCGGDSLNVWDLAQHRMAVFSPTGTFVRQFIVPSDTSQGSAPTIYLACSPRGTIAYQGEPNRKNGMAPTGTPGVMRGVADVLVVDARGKVLRNLGAHPMGEWVAVSGGGFPRPLGPTTSMAIAGDRIYVGTGDSAAVQVYSPDGKVSQLKLGLAQRATTRAQFVSAGVAIASMGPKAIRDRATQALSASPMPASLPPYAALFGDNDGVLWVQTSVIGDPTTRLHAYGSDQKSLGEVTLPTGLTIHEIGRDYVLASFDDKDDIPHVAVYRLHRGK